MLTPVTPTGMWEVPLEDWGLTFQYTGKVCCAKRGQLVPLPRWGFLDPCHSLLKDKDSGLHSCCVAERAGKYTSHVPKHTHTLPRNRRYSYEHTDFIFKGAHSTDLHLTTEAAITMWAGLTNILSCSHHAVGTISSHTVLQCLNNRMLEWKHSLRMSSLGH